MSINKEAAEQAKEVMSQLQFSEEEAILFATAKGTENAVSYMHGSPIELTALVLAVLDSNPVIRDLVLAYAKREWIED